MLHALLGPLSKTHLLFNLFNYLSFRTAGAVVTALLIAFVIGPWVIRRLREKKVGQVIRAEGPASHQGKRGTPTMGGVIILLATVGSTLLWADFPSGSEGPASREGKRGTRRMGGVIILIARVVSPLLWADFPSRFVVTALGATLWMGGIGFVDDYLKIVQGKPRGLGAKWNLIGQCSFGLALGLPLLFGPAVPAGTIPPAGTTIPFFKYY